MTPEQEIEKIYDVIKSLAGEIAALMDELQPYFSQKRMLDEELQRIPFADGTKTVVSSTKFCGISPMACAEELKRYGEIIEPGHFTTVEREVLQRDRDDIADRRTLFAELIDLAEEWGPKNNRLRDLKADRLALGRRVEVLQAMIKRAARKKRSRAERPATGQEDLF